MAGLCEDGNEPSGSLKAICKESYVEDLRGKRLLVKPRRIWEDNIKIDLREVGYDGRDWINLAQDTNRLRAYVWAEMNLRIPLRD
ncbi:hypothetical protein ANN_00763 [Periplaneta americana]|uniref:Uncharacterized protein n=1 Tax=Periplaneta americana TaxID=6978 RepID=A0ABQ8TRS0_PERAM|nr:hypothetical protein ANN_00763 [Periplaneta americana]